MGDSDHVPRTFMFVNDNVLSGSLDCQFKRQNSDIRRHVQHHLHRMRHDTRCTSTSKLAPSLITSRIAAEGWRMMSAKRVPCVEDVPDLRLVKRETVATIPQKQQYRDSPDVLDAMISSSVSGHGNSDPFNCQMISVTPRVNQAVSFVRCYILECWSPSFTFRLGKHGRRSFHDPGLGIVSSIGSSAALWMWRELLANTTIFWSAIASSMPLMLQYMPEKSGRDLVEIHLRIKAHSIRQLRNDLQGVDLTVSPKMSWVWHIITLFNASCIDGDIISAACHAKVLRELFERLPTIASHEVRLVRSLLWSDSTSALFKLRRPVLDYDNWISEMLAPVWLSAQYLLPDDENYQVVPPYVQSRPLVEAFSYMRMALHDGQIANRMWYNRDIREAELIFHMVTTKAEYHIGCLLNLYHDLMGPEKLEGLSEGQRYTEIALALALLHQIQKSFKDVPTDDTFDRHDSTMAIYPQLKISTERAILYCSQAERTIYEHAHFWVLYIGACCEERISPFHSKRSRASRNNDPSFSTWFHEQLMKKCQHLGVANWTDARLVLSKFAFDELLTPLPRLWTSRSGS